MKQETKELIDWIKKQINIAKTNNIDPAWNGKHEAYNADYEKAMAFLDSLPEIEARLTRGGYIQDKNGTPCCDGDKVEFETILSRTEHYKGYLLWEADEYRFFIMNQSPKLNANEICMANIRYFTKVE